MYYSLFIIRFSLKEAAETEYWLRLLALSGYTEEKLSERLLRDCLAIKKLLILTLNTAKSNNN